MTTVTGFTADRMKDIEDAAIIDGDVIGGNLILTRHDGTQINAGSVIGPAGPEGPVGSDLDVITGKPILDLGLVDQIRAGRQLSPADFANIGLSAPLGLWNLSNLADVSGNGRNLLNKGSVTFAPGINGITNTAAQFTGSTTQSLYIADSGVNDPFRVKTGSIGAWFRTAKSSLSWQVIISKRTAPASGLGYQFSAYNNKLLAYISATGTGWDGSLTSISDVCDDRWHFGVFTYDGSTYRLYIDGILETLAFHSFPIFGSSGPLNIGSQSADGSTAATDPCFGRIDEVFVTTDILTEDQIRNLYCAKIPHTLGEIPSRVTLNIRRRRKGPALVIADFPVQPIRLYNFSAGSLANEGSQGAAGNLTNTGAISIPGVDGTPNNAFGFFGAQYLRSTDTGLPAGTTPFSYGCWIKTADVSVVGQLISWGTSSGVNDTRLYNATGKISFGSGSDAGSGPFVADGNWHFIVVVQDNAAIDGVKRKLYVDGRLVLTSTVINSIVLGGANKFVIGSSLETSYPFIGQIDGVFVNNTVFTLEDILKLYTKGTQTLASSPKNVGDHIEAMSSTDLLAIFDTLDSVNQVDLKVTA